MNLRDRPWPGRLMVGHTMNYFVYILKSFNDRGYYIGMTKNIEKRLDYHNRGYVKSTKSRIPFIVVYIEKFPTRIEARNREKYLKSYQGSKEKLLILDSLK